MKHTQHPWRVEGRYVKAMKAKTICNVPDNGVFHGKVDEANARLIAASPELLIALKKCQEDINWMLNNRQFLNADSFDYIDEAIAKAVKK